MTWGLWGYDHNTRSAVYHAELPPWFSQERRDYEQRRNDWNDNHRTQPPATVMYHATSPKNRDSILQQGLLTDHSQDDGEWRSVYMSPTEPEHSDHQDIWAIDPAQLKHLEEEPEQSYEFGGSYFTDRDVPPTAMRLHRPAGGPHTAARTAMPSWYHLTDNPDFKLDPAKHPNRPYGLGEWEQPGVFLTQRPGDWAYSEDDDSWSGDRPYVAEIDAPDNLHELPGAWYDPDGDRPTDKFPGSEETFVPADQFHHLTVKNVRPRESRTMTAAVTVYTSPSCPQCFATKKHLDKLGIEHQTVDVTQDPEAHAFVTGLGYTSAPVVVAGDSHWSGYRPDRLKGLISE